MMECDRAGIDVTEAWKQVTYLLRSNEDFFKHNS